MVASSFQGIVPSSGIGTFYSALAEVLVASRHNVTLLFTQGNVSRSVEGDFEYWRRSYLSQGIQLVPLPPLPAVEGVLFHAKTSWTAYRWLREREGMFDIIHVHDYQGHGYFTVLAKRLKLAFRTTTVVVMTHGPLRWAKIANGQQMTTFEEAEVDFLEQQSIRLSKVVISPSQYLCRWAALQGWHSSVPAQVIPLLVPRAVRNLLEGLKGSARTGASLADLKGPKGVEELIFFGRLEGRKGAVDFCDAVDFALKRGAPSLKKVTFLGGSKSFIKGQPSREYLLPRAKLWRDAGLEVEILDSKDTGGALQYLLGGSTRRCAVIPSRSENSPMAVIELLAAGVPFLASDAGGIPELIAPSSRNASLFQARNFTALSTAILQALDTGVAVPHAARSFGNLEELWVDWHVQEGSPRVGCGKTKRLRGTAPEEGGGPRRKVAACLLFSTQRPGDLKATFLALLDQEGPLISRINLVLLGTVTDDAEQAAQELAARQSSGRIALGRAATRTEGVQFCARESDAGHLLLLDAGAVLKPEALRTLLSSLSPPDGGMTAASLLYGPSLQFDSVRSAKEVWQVLQPHNARMHLPLGPAVKLGAFSNVLGTEVVLMKTEIVEEAAEAGVIGHHRGFWELLIAAALRGKEVQVVPEPLCWVRSVHTPPRGMSDLKRLLGAASNNFTSTELREIYQGTNDGVRTIMEAKALPNPIVED